MTLTQPFEVREHDVDTDEHDRWVRRSREGDLEAFNTLAAFHYAHIYRLTARLLGDPEAAKDATQEVFIKAWRNLPRFRADSRFSTWLHAIAVNQCISLIRRRSREQSRARPLDDERPAPLPPAEIAPSPLEVLYGDRSLALREALLRLPEKLRQVVTMHYYAGQTAKEIAGELGVPVQTVYSRLRLALQRLHQALEKEMR